MCSVVCDILQEHNFKDKEVITMKEKVSPAMVGAVIALLVLIIGFMGWKFLGPGSKNGSGENPYGSSAGTNGPPRDHMPASAGGTATGSPDRPMGSPDAGSPGSGGSSGH